MEIKIGGFGGQGVILAGVILGKAATIYEGKFATLTQSFGPEARGSACSARLIISQSRILYPYVRSPEILLAMSQDAYNKFEPEVKEDGIVIIESDLVKPKSPRGRIKLYGVPATRLAEELGRRLVLNIVMLGSLIALTGILSEDALRRAIKDSVPRGTEEINLQAFNRGLEYAKEKM